MKRILFFATALLLFFACSSKQPVQQDALTGDVNYERVSITGMSCTGCEETITAGVTSLEGVQDATADYQEGAAWVSYDPARIGHEEITAAIESKGYKVTGFEPWEGTDSTVVMLN